MGGKTFLKAVLDAVVNRVVEILADPVDEALALLPELLYFINANGVSTAAYNLAGGVLNAVNVLFEEGIISLEVDGTTYDTIEGYLAASIGLDIRNLDLEGIIGFLEAKEITKGIKINEVFKGTYTVSDDGNATFTYDSASDNNILEKFYCGTVEAYTYGAENGIALVQMMGLPYDDPKWDELLNELKLSEEHALFNKSGWGSTAVDSIGKPKTLEFDAPHGIANFLTGETLYHYPCATMLAATWNQELQHEYGITIGNDAIATNTSGWYAPGINIHRTPFGARNYEYYSEDAVLTGLCAANVTEGTESKGMHAYIKHFVMNDADTNRAANGAVAVWGTEQAAREIYLKPFQYAIEKGNAQGIMLTMCRVGWQYTFGSYPLMTAICRGEYGFNGCYITDYTTTMKGKGSDMYLAAGGNLVHATAEQTLSDVKAGWCRALIRDAVHSILYNTANSLAMNGIEGGEKAKTAPVKSGFPIYKIALFAFDAVVGLLLLFGMFKVYSKCRMTEEQFQNRKRMTAKGKRILWIVLAVLFVAIVLIFIFWAWPLLVKAFKI